MAIKRFETPGETCGRDRICCRDRLDSVVLRQHRRASSVGASGLWSRAAWLLVCAGMVFSGRAAQGQDSAAPATRPAIDTATFMSRAMQQYNGGDYQACIEGLTRLLQVSPGDTTARFFRALGYGQLAVASERRALVARSQGHLDEAGQHELHAAEQYRLMRGDIEELLRGGLTTGTAIIQLIDGVVQTKLASYTSGDYKERVAARAELLSHARQALEAYVHPPEGSGLSVPLGLNRVRGEYFLGVVVYRQALRPAEEAGRPDETADPNTLNTAGELMAALQDPKSDRYVSKLLPNVPAAEVSAWLSYASLYLGLIRTRQGNLDALESGLASQRYFSEARDFFEQAWKLDTGENYPDGADKSAGRGLIPQIAEKHIPAIENALKGPGPAEDLFINWESGFAYDSNVILLGHDTHLPANIGRKDDVRFGTGINLGYTLDLAKISPSLDRWTVGVLGRASSNWHGDIHEFNEQNYGGSVALQYRMLDAKPSGSWMQGPLYASMQYDYDHFLLGNNGYLHLNRVSPQFTYYSFDQHAASSFGFHYEDRSYSERLTSDKFRRDGNYFAFDASQSVDLVDMTALYKQIGWEPWGLEYDPTDPTSYDPNNPKEDTTGYQRALRPYLGFEYGWDSTRGQEFDTNRFMLVSGLTVPLPYGVQFDFGGQWEWQDYYHRGDLVDYHRRSRDDLIQRYRFGFERSFVLVPGSRINRTTAKMDRVVMSLRADVQFTDDDSNVEDRLGQDIFSYDRAIWGLSVSFQFN
jgi:hypothetical protein